LLVAVISISPKHLFSTMTQLNYKHFLSCSTQLVSTLSDILIAFHKLFVHHPW